MKAIKLLLMDRHELGNPKIVTTEMFNEAIAELEEFMKPKTCDRQVFYKCVHCNDTFKIIEEVKSHEKECSYNPIAHKCDTCKSLIWEYGNDHCLFCKEKGTYDIWDNREECPYHEPKDNA